MISQLLSTQSAPEMASLLAGRLRGLRLNVGWTRVTLAARAGVTPASLKRFETTGKGSLELVLKIAHALGRLDELAPLWQLPPARSLEELERRAAQPVRRRGRR